MVTYIFGFLSVFAVLLLFLALFSVYLGISVTTKVTTILFKFFIYRVALPVLETVGKVITASAGWLRRGINYISAKMNQLDEKINGSIVRTAGNVALYAETHLAQ